MTGRILTLPGRVISLRRFRRTPLSRVGQHAIRLKRGVGELFLDAPLLNSPAG